MNLARMLPRLPVPLSKPAFNAFGRRFSGISSWSTPARVQAEPLARRTRAEFRIALRFPPEKLIVTGATAGPHDGGHTAANEADITQTAALLHRQEEDVFGDAGYAGAEKRPELEDREVSWNIAIKRSIIKDLPKALRELAEPVERALSQVRAVVEHPFHIRTASTIRSCAIAASRRTRRSFIPLGRYPARYARLVQRFPSVRVRFSGSAYLRIGRSKIEA